MFNCKRIKKFLFLEKFAALILPILIYLSVSNVEAKTVRGIVVNKDMKKPLPGSLIMLFEKKAIFAMALTDSAGMFCFDNITRDRFNIRVSSIGFADALVGPLHISKRDTLKMVIALEEEEIVMHEILVEEKRLEEGLKKVGFYDRKEIGSGKYLEPGDVSGSYGYTSQLLRKIMGIKVFDGNFLGDCKLFDSRALHSALREEELTVYLDGLRLGSSDMVNLINPGDIAAVEFYHIGETPQQYYGRSGSLLIWTKK